MMNDIALHNLVLKMDENVVENICWSDKNTVDVSPADVRTKVRAKVTGEVNHTRKPYKAAIALCCLLVISVPCYALVSSILERSAVVDDTNRHLIGKEVQSDYYIIYDGNGTYTDSYGNTAGNIDDLIPDTPAESRLVESIEAENLDPSSYVEIQPKRATEQKTVYPELIMVNNSACILTKDDGSGWKLNAGDSFSYEYEKAESEVVEEQTFLIGVIQDGIMKEPIISRALAGEFTFTAKEAGEYYIYLLSASSDYLTIEEGIIKLY